MADKKKDRKDHRRNEDVMAYFEDIDQVEPEKDTNATAEAADANNDQDEQSVLDFLDEIGNRRRNDRSPRKAAAAEAPKNDHPEPTNQAAESKGTDTHAPPAQPSKPQAPRVDTEVGREASTSKPIEERASQPSEAPLSGWGWSQFGSFWGQASAAVKTAEQAMRDIQSPEDRKRLEEKVKSMVPQETRGRFDINSLSMSNFTSTLNSVLNAVAPPIAAHEVLKVAIYHDMIGYPQLEQVVYTVFDRVMSQVEGGELAVQRGKEGRRRDSDSSRVNRDLSVVDGLENAAKLAKANAEEAVKQGQKDAQSKPPKPDVPVHTSNIILSIQAGSYTSKPLLPSSDTSKDEMEKQLCFVAYLRDSELDLTFVSQSQAFPYEWNEWQSDSEYERVFSETVVKPKEWTAEWFEEGLSLAVGVVAQRYVASRMGLINGEILKGEKAEAKEKEQTKTSS